jgi:hypothetical protein
MDFFGHIRGSSGLKLLGIVTKGVLRLAAGDIAGSSHRLKLSTGGL